MGRALGREARWQEGCKCHEDILKDMPAWKREKEQMTVDDNGNAFCIWRGCRAVENALGRLPSAQSGQAAKVPRNRYRSGYMISEDIMISILCAFALSRFHLVQKRI